MKNWSEEAQCANGDDLSEDPLTSTMLALKFLYHEALRNNHFAIAAILRNTLDRCDRINLH